MGHSLRLNGAWALCSNAPLVGHTVLGHQPFTTHIAALPCYATSAPRTARHCQQSQLSALHPCSRPTVRAAVDLHAPDTAANERRRGRLHEAHCGEDAQAGAQGGAATIQAFLSLKTPPPEPPAHGFSWAQWGSGRSESTRTPPGCFSPSRHSSVWLRRSPTPSRLMWTTGHLKHLMRCKWSLSAQPQVQIYFPDARCLFEYSAYESGLSVKSIGWLPCRQFFSSG